MPYKSGVKITWSWQQEGPDPVVPEHDKESLDEAALERANEMMAEGYIEGELSAGWSHPSRSYRGWWTKEEIQNDG